MKNFVLAASALGRSLTAGLEQAMRNATMTPAEFGVEGFEEQLISIGVDDKDAKSLARSVMHAAEACAMTEGETRNTCTILIQQIYRGRSSPEERRTIREYMPAPVLDPLMGTVRDLQSSTKIFKSYSDERNTDV